MPDEEESRRRRAVLFVFGIVAWFSRLLPIANFIAIHRKTLGTKAGQAADWTRKKIQKAVSYLRQHGTALAATFVGVGILAILGAGLTGLFDERLPGPPPVAVVPSPTGSALSSDRPGTSPSNSTLIPPSLSPSGSSGPAESARASVIPSRSSTPSPRPTSSAGRSPTPEPHPSSKPTPTITPSPVSTPTPRPSPPPTPSQTPNPSTRPTPEPTTNPTPAPSVRPHDCRHAPRCHKPPKTGATEAVSPEMSLGVLVAVVLIGLWFERRRL